MTTPARRRRAGAAPHAEPRTVAVIDIGATSIRMEIAELRPAGATRLIDALTQPVSLGKDTFTLGMLLPSTIVKCFGFLLQFLQSFN